MTTDVLARLRQADPQPDPPSYPEAVIAAKVRAIIDTDADTFTAPSSAVPGNVTRGHRRGAVLLSVAAVLTVAVALGVALDLNAGSPRPGTTPTSTSAAPRPAPNWRRFTDASYRISFRYPPAWHTYRYDWAFSFTSSVVYLSPQHVPDPCVRTRSSLSCGTPAIRLSTDGVLVTWTESGFPHTARSPDAIASAPGERTTIGGHAARVFVGDADASCSKVGATRSVRATIARTPRPADDVFDMTACLAPGDQAANTRAVLAMLRSVRIGG